MNTAGEPRHPGRALRMGSEYAWRILVIGAVGYVGLRILSHLMEVVISFALALLVTALLQPVQHLLRRRGVPRGLSTLISLLVALVVFGGLLSLVVIRALDQFPRVGDQINDLLPHLKNWLVHGPLHLSAKSVGNVSATLSSEINKHSSAVASTALSTGKTVVDVLTGFVLAIFVIIFLLYDGPGIWEFLTRAVPEGARTRVDEAGRAAWYTLGHYVRGTLVVAVFHGVASAIALTALGVPLVLPLSVLIALGSFIPIVGSVLTGLVAIGVAGLTQGPVAAIVMTAVLIADSQIEGHVLQPFVVGRYVHIHPLAVVTALAAGALLLSLFGAVIAVPLVACANAAIRVLIRSPDREPAMDPGAARPSPAQVEGTVPPADDPPAGAER